MNNFELQEALFSKLLLAITGILSGSNLLRIHEYIFLGKPNFAIEAVAMAFEEENKFVTPEIVSLVHDLAITMDNDPDIYTKKLHIECQKNEANTQDGMMIDFKSIESLFAKLSSILEKIFDPLEISLVHIYLDVGRYEVALNVAICIFVEKEKFKKKKFVTPEIISFMRELASAMNRDPEVYIRRLSINDEWLKKPSNF